MMKTFVVFGLAMLCMGVANAQKVLNKNKQVVGYITEEGVVQDSAHQVLGYFIDNGSITDSDYETQGYIRPDGAITTVNNQVLGYYKNDIVYNAQNQALGSVSKNGTLFDSKGLEIGYLKGVTDDVGAISVFFFFYLTGVDYYNDPSMIRGAAGIK